MIAASARGFENALQDGKVQHRQPPFSPFEAL
jgi:hypothetical protein